RREVGMVFQHFTLFPHMTVLENLCLAQRVVRKRGKAEREAKARALLAKVGIGQKADEYPSRLSGGQQRPRLGLALGLAALAHHALGQAEVLEHGHVREQVEMLEHHADFAA
ncbi:ATP-binding cassette domain-containing protein, partial [Pseudomonas aeruginosa]